jgi:hypothetical protein
VFLQHVAKQVPAKCWMSPVVVEKEENVKSVSAFTSHTAISHKFASITTVPECLFHIGVRKHSSG